MSSGKTPDEVSSQRRALKRSATVVLSEDGSGDEGAKVDSPYAIKRRNAVATIAPPMEADDSDEMDVSSEGVVMELKVPNLYEYFLAFGIEVEEQIKLCRTYASAQAAMLRCVRPKDQD